MRRIISATLLAFAAPLAIAAPDLDQAERLVNRLTNEFRAQQQLPGLEVDPRLARAAQAFAEYMAHHDRYGHEADGQEPADRAKAQGYDYCRVAENISYQFTTGEFGTEELARRYVEGWKSSPGHRRNMVEPHATHMAAAVARSTKTGRYYAVQMFGRPRASAIQFRVANASRSGVRYRMGTEEFALKSGQERVHTTCTPPSVTFPDMASAAGEVFAPVNGERLWVEGDKRLGVRSER